MMRSPCSKTDRVGVPAADDEANSLVALCTIRPAEERSHGCGPAGLGSHSHHTPEGPLRRADGLIIDQHDVRHEALRNGEHELSDTLRCERVGRYTAGWAVNRSAGLARANECRGGFGLDSDNSDSAVEAVRNSPDETSAPDGRQ